MLDTEKELLREKIQEALTQQSQEQKVRLLYLPGLGRELPAAFPACSLPAVFTFAGIPGKVPPGGNAEEQRDTGVRCEA